MTTLQIDGAMGEGGGQVLRSALSLSLLTGQSFRLSRIRANRDRPGLRPQHLAAVRAAATVSGADVRGDRVGSEAIAFAPGLVRPGDYFFDIGTAGATSLVLQTLLLPLALAPNTSSVTIRGGTRGKRAERVADEAVDALAAFLGSDGAVDPWLADQLLLPLALADGPSELRTSEVTAHLLTNAEVIQLFLPVEIGADGPLGGPATVQVRPGPVDPRGLTREAEEPCSAGT
jgi:RNA 3'-terminal phosphate cyclase